MTEPVYDTIGAGYNTTRKADRYIAERMLANLQPVKNGLYLDVGCGTGNYLSAFTNEGYNFYGADPSETMLEKARLQCPGTVLVKASVESLPFESEKFDGATAMFTMHHWTDKQQGLNELYRVLKPGSKLVFLSFTAQQMEGYWLAHYFPLMIKRSGETIPSQDDMIAMCKAAGFTNVATEKYFVHDGLQDHFLYSGKHQPERYLDPAIRNGISSFTAFSNADEVARGLQLLKDDISSRKIETVIREYENNLGDYLFYIVDK